jgi:DNA repair protein RadC
MNNSIHNISRKHVYKFINCVLGQNSSKSSYNLLLDSYNHVIKIHVVERNVDIYYSYIDNNIVF